MVNREGFRKALKAALDGPELKDVEWTTFGHDFNVKQVRVTKTSDGLLIDGGDGRHISHRKRFRPDDQVFYKCRITEEGEVKDLEVNIKSTADILKEWFKTAGEIIAIVGAIVGAGKADEFGDVEPIPSSLELLDGDWEGDVEFLIANIIAVATARNMPKLAEKKSPKPVFTANVNAVNPAIIAEFNSARSRLAES